MITPLILANMRIGALARAIPQIGLRRTLASSTVCRLEESDNIHRLDLRVGEIVHVEAHPEADHLFVEQVSVPTPGSSETGLRTIVSGLARFMAKETLLNKHVIVAYNMKSSKFRGVLSQGMLLAASKDDQVAVLEAPLGTPLGERIGLEGVVLLEPDAFLKPKQKIFENIAEHMRTDPNGMVLYKNRPLVTSCGPVACESVPDGKVS